MKILKDSPGDNPAREVIVDEEDQWLIILIKTNFLGRDGFRWWIGQVPPAPNHKVNHYINDNWGLKRRVRIMGYHPDEKQLPDKDLPLALVLLPPTAGTGAANQAQSIYIEPGEIVLGFS